MPTVDFDRDRNHLFSGGVPYAPLDKFSGQEGAALANAVTNGWDTMRKNRDSANENAMKTRDLDQKQGWYDARAQEEKAQAQQRVIDNLVGPAKGLGTIYTKAKKVSPDTASAEVESIYAPVRAQLRSVGIPAPDQYDDKTHDLFQGYISKYLDKAKPKAAGGEPKETQKDRDDNILAKHYGVPVDVIKAGRAAGGGKVDEFFIDEWKNKQNPGAAPTPEVPWYKQAMNKVGGMFSGGPEKSPYPEYPDAKKAPDGKWYVERNGKRSKIID
jgi:hypothetical protein